MYVNALLQCSAPKDFIKFHYTLIRSLNTYQSILQEFIWFQRIEVSFQSFLWSEFLVMPKQNYITRIQKIISMRKSENQQKVITGAAHL